MTFERARKLISEIRTPAGFVRHEGSERLWGDDREFPVLRFESGDGTALKLDFFEDSDDEWSEVASGHTYFIVDGRRFSFDRTGVDDSFHIRRDDAAAVEAELARQIERVAKRKKFHETSVSIPQVGHQVQPETVTTFREKLRAGGRLTFTPPGFGVGYVVSTKKTRWAKPASRALTEFFGVGQLYVETLDCD